MADGGLEFRILGPLEVWADGLPMPIGGPRQRALLAILLLSANRVVSRDRLVDAGAEPVRHVHRPLRDTVDAELREAGLR